MQTGHISTKPSLQAVPVQGKGGKMVVAVTCSKCGTKCHGSDRPYAPLDIIMRHFAEKGWRINARGTTATCPTCQKESAAPPPPPVAAISAEFERQRQAEEKRQTEAAEAAKQADPDHADCERLRAIVAALPLTRAAGLWWEKDPAGVAEIVGLYVKRQGDDRIAFLRKALGDRHSLLSTIYQFRRGRLAQGSREWPELRSELTRRGIGWEDKGYTARAKPLDNETTSKDAMDNKINGTSVDAARAQVQVVRLLDTHFSVKDGSNVGTYADGWTDERVAKESGLALPLVVKMRVSAYGEIVDPRAAKLEADLLTLKGEATAARSFLAELDAKIAALGKQVADIRRGRMA